jgi:hypothetical protein
MRTFTNYRPNPPADYQATGAANPPDEPQFQGVIFDDGTVVLRWLTPNRSWSIWPNWATMYAVHGHPEYGTFFHFDDEMPEPS